MTAAAKSLNVLITGARAPVAVEWARVLLRSGHRVWLADCLAKPMGRYLAGIQGYLRLPAPTLEPAAHTEALPRLLRERAIDLVIPTCEEIFHLAPIRDADSGPTRWYMPATALLYALHNKFSVMDLASGCGGVKAPETRLLDSPDAIADDPDTILKPVYSRFGMAVIRRPRRGVLDARRLHPGRTWVQQQKIVGQPWCNYALYDAGRLLAHQAYRPSYLLNGTASSYFDPVTDARLDAFAREFGARTGFHGQVAFDFMEQAGVLYLLECNPRATSGLHLLGERLSWSAGEAAPTVGAGTPGAMRIGAVLPLFFGVSALFHGELGRLRRDYRRARDVLHDPALPLARRAQWATFAELLYRVARYRRSLTHASTFDMEWDGPSC